MLPGHVVSDDDDGTEAHAYYAGRWSLLVDLQAEFGGAFGAYLLFAFVVPGLMVASVYFEWTERPELSLFGAAALFIMLVSISLYALIWYRWAKKREQLAFETMQRRGEEELKGAEERIAKG